MQGLTSPGLGNTRWVTGPQLAASTGVAGPNLLSPSPSLEKPGRPTGQRGWTSTAGRTSSSLPLPLARSNNWLAGDQAYPCPPSLGPPLRRGGPLPPAGPGERPADDRPGTLFLPYRPNPADQLAHQEGRREVRWRSRPRPCLPSCPPPRTRTRRPTGLPRSRVSCPGPQTFSPLARKLPLGPNTASTNWPYR